MKNIPSFNEFKKYEDLIEKVDPRLVQELKSLETAEPYHTVNEGQLMNVVKNVLSNLSAKEAAILRLRFGLSEDIEETLYTVTDAEKLDIISGKGLS
jgi:DNA-directed RNA polymerase sigma subunit (sigma70/sigma32)